MRVMNFGMSDYNKYAVECLASIVFEIDNKRNIFVSPSETDPYKIICWIKYKLREAIGSEPTDKELASFLNIQERNINVVKMRYSNLNKKITYQKISDHFSITKERVRQIEHNVLRRLYHRCASLGIFIFKEDENF